MVLLTDEESVQQQPERGPEVACHFSGARASIIAECWIEKLNIEQGTPICDFRR